MSEDVKPRQWTVKVIHNRVGDSNNYEAYQIAEGPLIKGKVMVIELEPTLQLMKEMGDALKGAQHMFEALQYDIKQERGVGCDDKCSSYGHSTSCFLANDLHEDEEVCEVNKVLEKYRKFLEGIEK